MRASLGEAIAEVPATTMVTIMSRTLMVFVVAALFVANTTLIAIFSASLALTYLNVGGFLFRYMRETSPAASFALKKECSTGGLSITSTVIQLFGMIMLAIFWFSGVLVPR